MFGILLICLVLLLIYVGLKKGFENEHYFKNRNIKTLESSFALGGTGKLFLCKENAADFVKNIYNKFPDEKAFGLLQLRTPFVCIRDPELLKQLVVKNFDHFTDRQEFIDETFDPLFGNSVFFLKGAKWRDMRATLSPAFTGSKMRQMLQLILEVSEQMVTSLRVETKSKGSSEYEMKELCSRFTNDVIALCAFGIKVNSMDDKENDFYTSGKELLNFSKPSKIMMMLLYRLCPALFKATGTTVFNEKVRNFFKEMVLDNMKRREETNTHRPDMIDLLLEVRKGTLSHQISNKEHDSAGFATVDESEIGLKSHKRQWTDDELVAQCFLFFVAGFDTSSAVMSFAIYELAVNPEYQERLYQEVKETQEGLNGNPLTYEVLQKMKFIDMITSETLRKWPPVSVIDRFCVKELDFDDGKGFKYKFETDSGLWIPIVGFHYDPKYYPNPEKFNPDRFSDENKHLINPDTYMPFSIGPRNCIGSRFALLEIKALLYHMVLNFSFHPVEKTQIPLKLKCSMGAIVSENGTWVGLKTRE